MPAGRFHPPSRRRARGQAAVEYLLVAGVLAAAILLPFDGDASVLSQMIDAIQLAWEKFYAALSVPQ